MVKFVPILGTIVLIGSIIQDVLGYQVAGGVQALRDSHTLVGILGFLLVVALSAIALRARTATIYSKITMTILTIMVLIQVIMGFQLRGGADFLVRSHEANVFVIVFLSWPRAGLPSGALRDKPDLLLDADILGHLRPRYVYVVG